MKLTQLLAALALAGTAGTAFANDVNDSPPFVGNTAIFAAIQTAGAFADSDFTSGTLNGTPPKLETLVGGFIEIMFAAAPLMATGPLSLVIKVMSGANFSHSGTLHVAAVQERGSEALMLAGLGVLGYVARRRSA